MFSTRIQDSWTSYMFSGAAAIVASWALLTATGCRVGNYVEKNTNPDPSGFYETKPQSLMFCTSVTKDCADAPVNMIPARLSNIISSPIYFKVLDMKSGQAAFLNPNDTKLWLPAMTDFNGKLVQGKPGAWPESMLWTGEKECYGQWSVITDGAYKQEPKAYTVDGFTVKGRVSLNAYLVFQIDGDCTSTLRQMADCYQSSKACGGQDQAENDMRLEYVQNMFGTYIDTGLIKPDEIPDVQWLGYKATYE